MEALVKYFEILFADTRLISRGRRATGALKNIQAMTADTNGGLLSPNIVATQACLDTYNSTLAAIETDSTFKEGDTIDLLSVDEQIYLELHLSYYLVLSKVAKTSSTFHDFFPDGLNESNHLTRENIPLILTRMIAAGTAHSGLFPTLTGIYTTHQTDYNTARTAQTGGMGGVSADRVAFLNALLALCIQLTDNVADIGKMFRTDVLKAMSYFDEASFYGPNYHIHRHYNGSLLFGTRVYAYLGVYTDKTHIQLKAKTAGVNFQICIVASLTDVCALGGGKQVNGVGAHTWKASDISPLTSGYIVITSLSLTDTGDWEIDVID
jgi:hypothetical protein